MSKKTEETFELAATYLSGTAVSHSLGASIELV
jgi:hypothetical protein